MFEFQNKKPEIGYLKLQRVSKDFSAETELIVVDLLKNILASDHTSPCTYWRYAKPAHMPNTTTSSHL